MRRDTIAKIEERRTIKSPLLQAKTRAQKQAAQKENTEQQKEVRRSTRQDKKSNIDELASSAKEAATRNNTRTLYEITRKLSGRRSISDTHVRGRLDGGTLTPNQWINWNAGKSTSVAS